MMTQISPDAILNIRQALHDLAQPLSAVTGLVDLLLLEMAETDPKLREVQTISEQLEKVLEIVGEIRRMAREASVVEPLGLDPAAHEAQGVLGLK